MRLPLFARSNGTFYNGNGKAIAEPNTYFAAVAINKHGYNDGFANGNGTAISNPQAYFQAVARHDTQTIFLDEAFTPTPLRSDIAAFRGTQ